MTLVALRRLGILGLILSGLVPLPAAASLTIAEYLEIKLGKHPDIDPAALAIYLAGTLDTLLIANKMANVLGTPRYFCEPQQDVELSIADLKAMVEKQIEILRLEPDFEERAEEMTVGQLVLTAMADRFPCPSF